MFIFGLLFIDRRLAFATTLTAALLGMPADAIASGHGNAEPVEEEVVESATGFRGVNLGEFSVRTFRPSPLRREEVSFALHFSIKNEEYPNFDRLYQHRKNKIRDQVIMATRLVPVDKYDDPELVTFRRRILLRLRRTLPELKIEDIHVSDFNLRVGAI